MIIIKIIIIFFLIIIFAYLNSSFIKYNLKYKKNINISSNDEFNIASEKWIVIYTNNPPKSSIFSLNELEDWRIVVIGSNEIIDRKWSPFKNIGKLVYLTLKDQLNLGYEILKYLPPSTYQRKNIGYLYAIEHGAKEIYDIDDDVIINLEKINWAFNKNVRQRITVCSNNSTTMINPYSYFGINDIWPRGFILRDLFKKNNGKMFFNLASNQINLKPLIYQNLINGLPDIDYIFYLTRIKNRNQVNITFSQDFPLLYLPGNYIAINSKNTKYLYDIFPSLVLPNTINQEICDIFRGFIIQKFSWKKNGNVLFLSSGDFRRNIFNNKKKLKNEKDLYFKINKFLGILKSVENCNCKDTVFIANIIKNLVTNKLLGKKDLYLYKAFINDLIRIGYNFGNNNQIFKQNDYFSEHSKLYIYPKYQQNILLKNNENNKIKIMKHKLTNKIYKDILLVINYNREKFMILNNLLIRLYHNNFPNIAFISPGKGLGENVISCPDSNRGGTAYMCFRILFNKYPNFKGYYIIDDDTFFKTWEIEYVNFDMPGLMSLDIKRWGVYIFRGYKHLAKLIYSNNTLLNRIKKYSGFDIIPKLLVDALYIPKKIMNQFCDEVERMYENKIFLEIAIPSALALLSIDEIQIINSIVIGGKERKYMREFLKKSYNYANIHPIKLSKYKVRKSVFSYIYFVNAKQY